MHKELPLHLEKYVVQQKQDSYTPRDQAVWRFSLRQLKHFLGTHGHKSYLSGLESTGIDVETIPSISDIDQKLNKLGWSAVPVSGFIPPRAFMEFQSLGFLPIASDIRTYKHILYTPAPDIVHEAAGHAPILSDPEFSDYLKNYAEVAGNAILNKKDILLYQAIRELSDTKEHPNSSTEEIKSAADNLNAVSSDMGAPSEAAILGRMNWWTAEYGLIGDLNSPKIFGAGLLSSISESENCLKSEVKKIPLSLECINFSYDITEEQPQLFVTPDFEHLTKVLNELSETMAYKLGGGKALEIGKNAETVNTVELNSGVQISGKIEKYICAESTSEVLYFKTNSKTQLSFDNQEIDQQGCSFHPEGYSCVLGTIDSKCLSDLPKTELSQLGFIEKNKISYKYENGISVSGSIEKLVFKNEKLILIQFNDCTVKKDNSILFDPTWGSFDLAIGNQVKSVYGGPADSLKYGEITDYPAKKIQNVEHDSFEKATFELYQAVRDLRNTALKDNNQLIDLIATTLSRRPDEWLLLIELLELAIAHELPDSTIESLRENLSNLKLDEHNKECISKGLNLASNLIV